MTNKKTTKRALFMSAMAMLLCFTMLLGTTYAWFTDSATSGSNVIKSGNLDLKLSYKPYGEENTTWAEVDSNTKLFGENALYEPGYTEAIWLKVENLGSLAFRYNIAINVASEKQGTNMNGEKFSLSDYLKVKYMTTTSTDMESNYYTTRESLDSFNFGGVANSGIASLNDDIAIINNGVAFSATDATNGAYSSVYVLVVISMPTTVGNEANHNGTDIPQIDFSLTALATQLSYESDSFGSSYDANAKYPVIIDLKADESNQITIDEGVNTTLNLNGNAVNNSVINNGNLTISGGEIKVDAAGLENSGNATLDDVEMEAGSLTAYSNITKGANANTTYNNVDVDSAGGGIGAVDGATVEFNSGSVSVDSTSTSGRYLFYAEGEGTVITINGGEFSFSATKNQKRAYIYAGSGTTVYVTGGTFGKASTRPGYTAGILGDGDVIITGGTFGFDPTTWVADGYVATNNNGVWTVTAN